MPTEWDRKGQNLDAGLRTRYSVPKGSGSDRKASTFTFGGLRDATARHREDFIEDVRVAVVQPHLERVGENALGEGHEATLLQRHIGSERREGAGEDVLAKPKDCRAGDRCEFVEQITHCQERFEGCKKQLFWWEEQGFASPARVLLKHSSRYPH